MLKNEYISCLHFGAQVKSWKINDFLMILNKEGWYCFPEKIICIIKKNNVKHDNNFYC